MKTVWYINDLMPYRNTRWGWGWAECLSYVFHCLFQGTESKGYLMGSTGSFQEQNPKFTLCVPLPLFRNRIQSLPNVFQCLVSGTESKVEPRSLF